MNKHGVYELAGTILHCISFDRYKCIYLTPLALFLYDIFQEPTTQVLINLKKLFFAVLCACQSPIVYEKEGQLSLVGGVSASHFVS